MYPYAFEKLLLKFGLREARTLLMDRCNDRIDEVAGLPNSAPWAGRAVLIGDPA